MCGSYADELWHLPWSPVRQVSRKRQQQDSWHSQKVAGLLQSLGEFQSFDPSTSGKLGQKGRGLWRLVQRSSMADNLCQEETEMFYSFCGNHVAYEVPKLVRYAGLAGDHELVQKMLALGSLEHKHWLASVLNGHIQYLIKHEFGCLVLQQLLSEAIAVARDYGADNGFVMATVQALKNDLLAPQTFVESSTGEHGNHVVQKWIELLQYLPSEEDRLQQVIQHVGAKAVTIGTTQMGCRVIQRLLEVSNSDELNSQLLNYETLEQLFISQFGNYIVQTMLDSSTHRKLTVFRRILDNFLDHANGHFDDKDTYCLENDCFWARHQYARYVVQKCVGMPTDSCPGWSEMQASLIQTVMDTNGKPKPPFRRAPRVDYFYKQTLEAMEVMNTHDRF